MIGSKYFKPLQDNELPVYGDIQYEVEDPETGEKHIETRKEIIGYEENSAPNTLKKYSEGAKWCNENDAHIENKDEYYQIIANVHVEPSEKELAEQARAKRNQLLKDSMWLVERHKSEKELGRETILTEDQYKAVLQYQQKLRDVPQQISFPRNIQWPKKPSVIIEKPKNNQIISSMENTISL